MHKIFISSLLIMLLIGLLLFGGCLNKEGGEGFSIYLTKEDIPPAQMPVMSRYPELEENAFLAMRDIISYNAQTHELKITSKAYQKITQLEVPGRGKSFLVCVDKTIIYFGAFWTSYSSFSYDGVTILKPLSTAQDGIVSLQLGYPAESFYGGEDPRNDKRVLDALQKSGKLVAKLSIADIKKIPGSFKGYELYSWIEKNEWYFTLITGTNRNKTFEEIVTRENYISEMGWVKVTVAGVNAVKNLLSKMPEGESVFWLDGKRTGIISSKGIELDLPPDAVIDTVVKFAKENKLDIVIGGR